MSTHADKKQKNTSRPDVNTLSEKQSSRESAFQFVDNRPEAIAQKKLQRMANESPQARQAFQGHTGVNRNTNPIQRYIEIKDPRNPTPKENGQEPKGKLRYPDGKFGAFDHVLWNRGIAYRATIYENIFGHSEDDIPEIEIKKTGADLKLYEGETEVAKFSVHKHQDQSRDNSSQYLTHMWTEPKFRGRGHGKRLLSAALQEFGFFRIGTELNMQFFRPIDPDDRIALTDDGDGFISQMLGAGIINHDHIFPNDHRQELMAFHQDQDDDQ